MDSRMLILAGGLPININGTLVSGIGVGESPGGHLNQKCAQAGLESILKYYILPVSNTDTRISPTLTD